MSAVSGLCSSFLLLLRKRETWIILACKVSHTADNMWKYSCPCQSYSFPVHMLCFRFKMLWVSFALLECKMFSYVFLAWSLKWLSTSKPLPSLFSPFAALLSENTITLCIASGSQIIMLNCVGSKP